MDFLEDPFAEANLPEDAIEDPFAETKENDDPSNPNKNENDNKDGTPAKKKQKSTLGPMSLTEKDLLSQKGLAALPSYFNPNKYYKPGEELKNVDDYLYNLESWCHNMYPKWQLDKCLEKIERLGKKMPVSTAVTKMRMGESLFEETDKLFDNQGQVEEADTNTNNPGPSASIGSNGNGTDNFRGLAQVSTPSTQMRNLQLTDEQKARMEENRLKALERKRLAQLRREEEALAMEMEG